MGDDLGDMRAGIAESKARLDAKRREIDDHKRRLDDHEKRISTLERGEGRWALIAALVALLVTGKDWIFGFLPGQR